MDIQYGKLNTKIALSAKTAMIGVAMFMTASTADNAVAADKIYSDRVKTLQTVAGSNWLAPAIIELGGDDVINISFDEMSHSYHRLVYHIDHCEADWSVSEEIFESDFLEGFNDNPIDDYENSLNTTVSYTHYKFSIPNEKCNIKLSGNYRVTVYDEDNGNEKLFVAEFMVVEPRMTLGISVTTNTDIDVNKEHQQLSMTLDYGDVRVTDPERQIYTVVMQNNREDNMKVNVAPNMKNTKGQIWSHNKNLIFDGGNEYHKYEILALSHATMGIDRMSWDGHNYHAYPFTVEPRKNYIYDEDADGAFFIRNSDNVDIDYTCDYVYVHYKIKSEQLTDAQMIVNGRWTTDNDMSKYVAEYHEDDHTYNITLLQKQGYYSFQLLGMRPDGTTFIPPCEGNYYQTENRYQAYVYFKPNGGRTWQLVAFRQLEFK